jgi:hypothetical protein
MRNFKARLRKLEAKKPPVKRVVRIYWADGTFVGEMQLLVNEFVGANVGAKNAKKPLRSCYIYTNIG